MKRIAIIVGLAAVAWAAPALAASDVSSNTNSRYAWGENIGWCDFYADGTNGVEVTPKILSGYVWCENVGWIHLGDGSPAAGDQYANTSATDYGVNHDGAGKLSGYAWGENIGWVVFDTSGSGGSQVQISQTGQFSGYAWGENIGWITMNSGYGVKLNDSDGDTIPDAFETNTNTYVGPYDTGTNPGDPDSDGDGYNDNTEIQGGTDPTDNTNYPGGGSEVWVDFGYTGTESGTSSQPYNTLSEGVTNVAAGGTIRIKGNSSVTSSSETGTINKSVTIQAENGAVRIGATTKSGDDDSGPPAAKSTDPRWWENWLLGTP